MPDAVTPHRAGAASTIPRGASSSASQLPPPKREIKMAYFLVVQESIGGKVVAEILSVDVLRLVNVDGRHGERGRCRTC